MLRQVLKIRPQHFQRLLFRKVGKETQICFLGVEKFLSKLYSAYQWQPHGFSNPKKAQSVKWNIESFWRYYRSTSLPDGASHHYAVSACQYVNGKLGKRWSDRGGPVAWQSQSQGLTPSTFFLWAYIQDRVFSKLVITVFELKTKFRVAVLSMIEDTSQKIDENTGFRMRLLLPLNRTHFMNLLNKVKCISIIFKIIYRFFKIDTVKPKLWAFWIVGFSWDTLYKLTKKKSHWMRWCDTDKLL